MQPRASAVFPCAGGCGLVPRAAQCLEGRCWARCRRQPTAIHPRGRATTAAPGSISPSEGENAAWCSGHGPPAQVDGRGPPPAASPARHVVLCGHRSVFSSPPGRRMFRLLTFFHEPFPSSLTHTCRMDGFCNQNADQLGSLAGLSFPAVYSLYVGVVECASASPYTYSS